MIRFLLLIGGIALGVLATVLAPAQLDGLRAGIASLPGISWVGAPAPGGTTAHGKDHDEHGHDDADGVIKLSDEQIAAAGIGVGEAKAGVLGRRLLVPGSVVPSGDRIARVAVRLIGTVAELRKRLGDPVEQNEVVAVIESRDVADAKSELLATRLTRDLQQTLFSRATVLREGKVMTENDYLRARTTAEEARMKHDIARQKLFALGLTEEQVAAIPDEAVASLRRQELRSPIAGRIAERRVDLGGLVGREGQESELFVIVDLAEVWVELAVSPADLALIAQGQDITVHSGATGEEAQARIIFVSPLLDKDTRSARVVALLANPAHTWKPGAFVTAEILLAARAAEIMIPKSALQTIKGQRVAFVRSDDGFQMRKIVTGREDDRAIEILSGLSAGDKVAIANTFVLKAELGKNAAEH
jgi:membrane fusion protein, heavy metal efflux system